jgi:hypothetical protein
LLRDDGRNRWQAETQPDALSNLFLVARLREVLSRLNRPVAYNVEKLYQVCARLLTKRLFYLFVSAVPGCASCMSLEGIAKTPLVSATRAAAFDSRRPRSLHTREARADLLRAARAAARLLTARLLRAAAVR